MEGGGGQEEDMVVEWWTWTRTPEEWRMDGWRMDWPRETVSVLGEYNSTLCSTI